MPAPATLAYFARSNAFTQSAALEWISAQLGPAPEDAFAFLKSILIHPVDAQRAKVRFDRSRLGLDHALHSTADSILSDPRLAPRLRERRLPLATRPGERLVLSCDHHALLYAALRRHAAVPVRTRTGFVTYIVPGARVPHWLCEEWDAREGRWRFVDPERRRAAVAPERVALAGTCWLSARSGRRAPPRSYSGLGGMNGLKYALLCDVNSLFKNELLGYEWRVRSFRRPKPEAVRRGYARLTAGELARLDRLAELSEAPDEALPELWEHYATLVPAESMRCPDPPPGVEPPGRRAPSR